MVNLSPSRKGSEFFFSFHILQVCRSPFPLFTMPPFLALAVPSVQTTTARRLLVYNLPVFISTHAGLQGVLPSLLLVPCTLHERRSSPRSQEQERVSGVLGMFSVLLPPSKHACEIVYAFSVIRLHMESRNCSSLPYQTRIFCALELRSLALSTPPLLGN